MVETHESEDSRWTLELAVKRERVTDGAEDAPPPKRSETTFSPLASQDEIELRRDLNQPPDQTIRERFLDWIARRLR